MCFAILCYSQPIAGTRDIENVVVSFWPVEKCDYDVYCLLLPPNSKSSRLEKKGSSYPLSSYPMMCQHSHGSHHCHACLGGCLISLAPVTWPHSSVCICALSPCSAHAQNIRARSFGNNQMIGPHFTDKNWFGDPENLLVNNGNDKSCHLLSIVCVIIFL